MHVFKFSLVDAQLIKRGKENETHKPAIQGRSQDFSKGGSHWVIQRVLTRLSPEYCGLSAYKKAYKGGVTGNPGPPLATPMLLNKTIKQLKARDDYSLSSPLLFLRNVWGHIVLFFCRRRPEGQRFQPPKASTMCRKTDQAKERLN